MFTKKIVNVCSSLNVNLFIVLSNSLISAQRQTGKVRANAREEDMLSLGIFIGKKEPQIKLHQLLKV